MRTLLYTVALAVSLLGTGCQTLKPSSSRVFEDDASFRVWFAFYYKDPKPEELRSAIDYMASHRYIEDYPDIASIFIANVMRAHPERLAAWNADFASLEPRVWDVLVISYWLIDSDQGRTLAHLGIDRAQIVSRERLTVMITTSPKSIDLLTFDAKDPRHINLMWAAFSATGDERYVEKVISYIHLYESEERLDAASLGEAAIMTLATNSLQHTAVAKIADEVQKRHPDARTRALLAAMLTALAQVAADHGAAPAH